VEKSNIFVYVELSKLTTSLSTDPSFCKKALKAHAGYFNIIDAKYFSSQLAPEWERILTLLKEKGPQLNQEGFIEKNAFRNTLFQMSSQQCIDLTNQILLLFEKVKIELGFIS